eukprot:1160980-Pelagomonas_calceolata.AAC.2
MRPIWARLNAMQVLNCGCLEPNKAQTAIQNGWIPDQTVHLLPTSGLLTVPELYCPPGKLAD